MAGYNKNILIGTGGREGINRSHFLGAVYGMERIMGQIDTPVRRVLNYATENFAKGLPIVYVLTVIGKNESKEPAVKGLFVGNDEECFNDVCAKSTYPSAPFSYSMITWSSVVDFNLSS